MDQNIFEEYTINLNISDSFITKSHKTDINLHKKSFFVDGNLKIPTNFNLKLNRNIQPQK